MKCKNCGHEIFFGDGYGKDKEKRWRHFAFSPRRRLKDENGEFINCPSNPCGRFIGRGYKMRKCDCEKPEPKETEGKK